MKYRKKPVVIEAVKFSMYDEEADQLLFDTVPHWIECAIGEEILYLDDEHNLKVYTLEGEHLVSKGDYVIQGIKGELYPCKPDIFEMTYEKL